MVSAVQHRRHLRQSLRAAFTLVELMVVLAIMLIVMGMIATAVTTARRQAQRTRARTTVRELTNAWRAYWITYGAWPPGYEGQEMPVDEDSLAPLLGENQRGLYFLQLGDRDLDSSGRLFDPWREEPYWFEFRAQDVENVMVTRVAVTFPNRSRYLD